MAVAIPFIQVRAGALPERTSPASSFQPHPPLALLPSPALLPSLVRPRPHARQLDPKTQQLAVTPEARAYLSKLKGTVGVCTVAGVYRTGKSYILNQLAGVGKGAAEQGFGVGSSVQAKTKGIWLWGAALKPSSTAPGAPKHVLLLDTEGLQSIDATEGHDAKIFSLAILLSSYFVYNSEKAINAAAIDQLSLVAQLTQRIRVHAASSASSAASATDAELSEFFPRFTWLLRDFQLELTSSDGREMTPDQYLDECLRPQPGSSAAVREQNETRRAILSLFRERSCIPLPHPTIGTNLPPSALKNLPALDQLATPFRDGVLQLKSRVLGTTPTKTLGPGSRPLNGAVPAPTRAATRTVTRARAATRAQVRCSRRSRRATSTRSTAARSRPSQPHGRRSSRSSRRGQCTRQGRGTRRRRPRPSRRRRWSTRRRGGERPGLKRNRNLRAWKRRWPTRRRGGESPPCCCQAGGGSV